MVTEYNGVELLQLLKEDKIPFGTKIYIEENLNSPYKFYTIVGGFRALQIWREEEGKEDILINRVIDTEDLINSKFIITEQEDISLEESIEVLNSLLKDMENIYNKTKINNTKERIALTKVLNTYKNNLIVPKKYLNEIKEQKIKENNIEREYDSESRLYLMNLGKISLCEVLEHKYGGSI